MLHARLLGRLSQTKCVFSNACSVSKRSCTSKSPISQKPAGRGAVFWLFFGGIPAAVGGTLVYAYADPSFRRKLEEQLPFSTPYLKKLMGETKDKLESEKPKRPLSSLVAPVKKTAEPETTSSIAKPKVIEKVDQPTETKEKDKPKVDLESEKLKEAERRLEQKEAEKKRAVIVNEKRLSEALQNADAAVTAALAAKQAAIVAIEHHTKLVKRALEDPRTDSSDPQWDAVVKAAESMQFAISQSDKKNKEFEIESEKLRHTINQGRESILTSDSPLITRADEKLNNMKFDLEEAQAKVRAAESEGKITTQMKDLIQQARIQFSKELKATLPSVDLTAKGKKLTEDELNAFLVHAYLRMDRLSKELAEQTARERSHIEQAIERQRSDDRREGDLKLERELQRLTKRAELDVETKVQELTDRHHEDLTAQLRRQAGAHAEHVEEVLRIQREQLEIEAQRKLEDARSDLRKMYQQQLAGAMGRIAGIESALEGRKDLDDENRRSKELWVACRNLKERVLEGRDGSDMEERRKPLANDVMRVREAGANNAFVNAVVSTIPDEALARGVYTENDLLRRFAKVERLCRRTAMLSAHGGTLLQYFMSYVQSIFIFESARPVLAQELLQADKLDTFGIVARASFCVQQRDFESALRLMMLLEGEPGRIARDWVQDTRVFLETRQAANILQAHAAATSIRTIY